MPANNPFFSIIIPTYNRANLIAKTIKTILDQSFLDFEIIIVDDGSTDNTEEVVRSINASYIRYFKKTNGERGAARNFGWQQAKGNFITFLDSDDILYPNHLEEAYCFIKKTICVTCFAQGYEIKEEATGSVLVNAFQSKEATINEAILKGNFLSCFGVFLKREVSSELQFEEDRRFAGTEDWLLWLQIAARYPFYYNNTVTGALLEHENRSVLSFNEESLIYRTEKVKEELQDDTVFVSRFGSATIKAIYAHMLSYTSLHLAMSRKKTKAFQYWLKAVGLSSQELFTKRSLAIAKKLVFHN